MERYNKPRIEEGDQAAACDASKAFVSPSSHSHSFLPTSASYTSLMHFPGRAHGMKNCNARVK